MRGPTAFRRPRWQSHSDTAIGLRGPARRSGRHDTHPMQRRGAKSFVDDLVLSRGVVLSRAAASLRSIETKPFDWQICPPRTDTSPRKARTLSWVEVQGALSLSLVAGSLPRALGRTGSWSHGLSVSERYPRLSPLRWGVVRCPRRSRAFLFRQSSISALWPLLSASVGRARSPAGSKGGERSRVLPGKAISVSSRWFPCWLPRLTKSTFRPVPACR